MTLLGVFVGIVMAIAVHELGHFIFGRMAGVRTERIVIGEGPLLWRTRLGATALELRLLPTGGYVMPEAGTTLSRGRELLFSAGGVLGNLALMIAISAFHHFSPERVGPPTGGINWRGLYSSIYLMQLYFIVTTLWPRRYADGNASDGHHLWRLIFNRSQ